MSLNRCPRRGEAHPAHPIRLYFSGAVVPTTCPGEGQTPDPVKCPSCGFYVNPAVHRADVCEELAAEREARRAERGATW